jgi:membrane protein
VRICGSAYRRYLRDDGDAMAGYIAFAGFLAIFPFAIFATALAGMFITPEDSDAIIEALFDLAPTHIAQTLEPVVTSVTEGAGNRLVTVSGVGAIWIASTAIEAIRVGLDRAYNSEQPRNFFVRRAIAMLFVLLATLTFGLLGFLIIVAPVMLTMAEHWMGIQTPVGIGLIRYGLALAMLSFFLFQLHMLLPTKRPPRRRLMPGIATSMVLWTLGAYGFSLYLAAAPSYSVTYGALAGVIVTLLFFFLTGMAILLGAQVNAVLMTFRRPTAADSLP